MKKYLRIGEAALFLGVCPETLRNWHRKGKLVPVIHPYNRYRIYNKKELEKFKKYLYEGLFDQVQEKDSLIKGL